MPPLRCCTRRLRLSAAKRRGERLQPGTPAVRKVIPGRSWKSHKRSCPSFEPHLPNQVGMCPPPSPSEWQLPGQRVSPLSVSLCLSSSHPGPVDVGCALCAVTSWSERTCGFEGRTCNSWGSFLLVSAPAPPMPRMEEACPLKLVVPTQDFNKCLTSDRSNPERLIPRPNLPTPSPLHLSDNNSSHLVTETQTTPFTLDPSLSLTSPPTHQQTSAPSSNAFKIQPLLTTFRATAGTKPSPTPAWMTQKSIATLLDVTHTLLTYLYLSEAINAIRAAMVVCFVHSWAAIA